MTQYGYGPLSPEDSGSTLLERLNGVVPALLTNHKGAARPGYVQPGMIWIDDSGALWLLNLFDGSHDIPFAVADPATHAIVNVSVPATRKLRVGAGLLLDGVAGSNAEPAEANLSADRLLSLASLTLETWKAGTGTTEAPISPEKLAAAIAARFGWDFIAEDQKVSSAAGGASVSGWQIRTLNTVLVNTIGASLIGNAARLPPGTYEAAWDAPANQAGRHRTVLYDNTHALNLCLGSSEYGNVSSDSASNRSSGAGRFTLSAQSDVVVRHFTGSASSGGDGLGVGSSSGLPEVFARLRIKRLS